jgi:hypothetical protein
VNGEKKNWKEKDDFRGLKKKKKFTIQRLNKFNKFGILIKEFNYNYLLKWNLLALIYIL